MCCIRDNVCTFCWHVSRVPFDVALPVCSRVVILGSFFLILVVNIRQWCVCRLFMHMCIAACNLYVDMATHALSFYVDCLVPDGCNWLASDCQCCQLVIHSYWLVCMKHRQYYQCWFLWLKLKAFLCIHSMHKTRSFLCWAIRYHALILTTLLLTT